jgi:hypothetical protein
MTSAGDLVRFGPSPEAWVNEYPELRRFLTPSR